MRIPSIGCLAFSGLCFFATGLTLAQEKLVAEGEAMKYFKGTEEPPVGWADKGFDDSGWLDGETPIGYSADLPYKTLLTDMQQVAGGAEGYLTVYTRRKFVLADPKAVKSLKLSLKYDDGFVAYINGVEVVRKAMPAGPVTHLTAATDHETNVAFEANFLACDVLQTTNLVAGDNVLAVEIHNASLVSSDCSLSFELEGVTDACPATMTCDLRATGQVLIRWTKPVGFIYDEISLYRNDVKFEPGPVKTATSYTDRTPLPGTNRYRLVAKVCGEDCTAPLTCSVEVGGSAPKFRRGDADDNGSVQLTDAVKLLSHLFRGEPAPTCPDGADFDDDGSLKLTDAVYLLTALFRGGPQTPAPGPETCGEDPTADALEACTYNSCPAA